jgi:hypothetical protein
MPSAKQELLERYRASEAGMSTRCIHDGMLQKRSRKGSKYTAWEIRISPRSLKFCFYVFRFTEWNTRYFRLEDHYLKYFKSRGSQEVSCVIDLRQVHQIEPFITPFSQYCFRLMGMGRIVLMSMSAHDYWDQEEW